MEANTSFTASLSARHEAQSTASDLTPVAIATRGREITGLEMFQRTSDDFTIARIEELITEMNADQPTGGIDMAYGNRSSQHLRFWKAKSESFKAPMIIFLEIGKYLDSIGSAKIGHLTSQGYAFATVNYSLIPVISVEEQVQEVADAVSYLVKNAAKLDVDPEQVILMGHSSGAHVVTLLGTDLKYLERVGISIHIVRTVISLDGSNYNALAEVADSPGPVAESTMYGLGTDPERLRAMSPTYHAHAPNAHNFLFLHAQRQGDIRQAVELTAALNAAGTNAVLRVFEGQGFEGHMQMLLRLGDPTYPATLVMDDWLKMHVSID